MADNAPETAPETAIAENLALLSGHYRSVAEVCRRIGINRQQFNKYLAGASRPSRHTMKRIGDFFGVEPHEMDLPPAAFADLIAVRAPAAATSVDPLARQVDMLSQAASRDVAKYLGTYFSYRLSFSRPDLVLKSVARIWQDGDAVYYKRIERYREDIGGAGSDAEPLLCKYAGRVMLLSDRLFIVEAEVLTRAEVSETVLYASHRNRVTWLSGLNVGVSTSDDRRIGCGRVLYQSLGQKVDLKRALGVCGKHDIGSDEIDPFVRRELLGGEEDADAVIFARPR